MKPWYLSKTLWFNIVMTLTDVAALLSESLPEPYKAGLLVVHGVGNIVLRVWFTNTELIK